MQRFRAYMIGIAAGERDRWRGAWEPDWEAAWAKDASEARRRLAIVEPDFILYDMDAAPQTLAEIRAMLEERGLKGKTAVMAVSSKPVRPDSMDPSALNPEKPDYILSREAPMDRWRWAIEMHFMARSLHVHAKRRPIQEVQPDYAPVARPAASPGAPAASAPPAVSAPPPAAFVPPPAAFVAPPAAPAPAPPRAPVPAPAPAPPPPIPPLRPAGPAPQRPAGAQARGAVPPIHAPGPRVPGPAPQAQGPAPHARPAQPPACSPHPPAPAPPAPHPPAPANAAAPANSAAPAPGAAEVQQHMGQARQSGRGSPNAILIGGAKIRLLAVDDDPDIVTLLRYQLGEVVEFVSAADGLEAMDRANRYLPDVLIVDWMIPKMSGLQFLQWLRRTPEFMKTPVIFLTAKNNPRDRKLALDNGAQYFMGKPFDPVQLLTILHTISTHPDFVIHGNRPSIAGLSPQAHHPGEVDRTKRGHMWSG